MPRLTLSMTPARGAEPHRMEVPDVGTALVVAEINLTGGSAELLDGDRVIATFEKGGRNSAPFWRVN